MHIEHLFRRWLIAAIILILIVSGCRATGEKLRGDTILDLGLPLRTTQQEGITLSKTHNASRAFLPVTLHSEINQLIVPDTLWADLEQLRQNWCQQPPKFVSTTSNDADYRIILKCEQADEDPI